MESEVKLPLTGLQTRVLEFIYDYFQKKECPPTITEVQEALEISNPGTVHKAVAALERKAYIAKEKHVSRGIRLTDLAKEVCTRNRQLKFELE